MKGKLKNPWKVTITFTIVSIILISTAGFGSAEGNITKEKDTKGTTVANPIVISDVKGGFLGISAVIKNEGDYTPDWVIWDISVTGGLFGNINRSIDGRIDHLEPGESETIFLGFIFGFGKITVEIEAITLGHRLTEVIAGFQLGFHSFLIN